MDWRLIFTIAGGIIAAGLIVGLAGSVLRKA